MKKATAILLSSAIFASLLCSCGKAADSSAVSSAVSTKTTSPTAAPTEAPTPEPTPPAGRPASQLFSKVTGFSREWQDGKHVINGLDASGNKICGIIDGNGNTVLMDGYTALYPLADGHLIAATDENVSGECAYTGRTMELSTAGFAGVILDENGNVIYQPDESLGYERLYPINSHLILSIRAKTGFDGKSASLCVLDQDGQFLYDCTDSSHNLADFMDFDDDGIVWTFSNGPSSLRKISFGSDDDLGENHILKIDFYDSNSYINYSLFEHDTFTSNYMPYSVLPHLVQLHYCDTFSCLDLYNSSCFILGGQYITSNATCDRLHWIAVPSDALDCTAINTWQDTLANEISYSDISFLGSDSSGLGYFCRTIYYDLMLTDSTKTFFTADGNEINIPENYLDALNSLILLDNKLLLTLNGADGNTYCTLLNPADGSALDPFFVPDSPYGNSQNDSILALGFCDSVSIYNIDTGEKQNEISIPDFSVRTTFFSGNYLIISGQDDDDSTYYHAYSLSDGALII